MRLIITLIFSAFSIVTFAQYHSDNDNLNVQRSLVNEALKSSKKMNSTVPIEELLKKGQISDPIFLSKLKLEKAYVLEVNAYDKDKCEIPVDKANEILIYYDSIVASSVCVGNWRSKYERHQFIRRMRKGYVEKGRDDFKEIYNSDLQRVVKMGYVPYKHGVGIGGNYFVGKDSWLGVSLSLFSGFEPKYTVISKLKNGSECPYVKGFNLIGERLKFGYNHSFKSSTNDFSFSLFEMDAPIVVIPAKFGIQYGPHTSGSQFYYRPGIGFYILGLSLSYNYNLMFDKSARSFSEKNLFCVNYTYIIDNQKI